ncbi:c-type cytochrome [Pseudoxanthomonas sp.]|uniref:c-type cytochrome n=1 Tax=Pseudoxanthomonas sp. TaxID=1871049 RepID=UPI00261541B6|nr:c-type cytochrome [Pseudoxanthomonas sp.]WDS37000.1 MAG: c-type cytochrome [Pseudoxanthomonas sp.]
MADRDITTGASPRLRRWRWGVVIALPILLLGPPLAAGHAANVQAAADDLAEDYTPQNLKVLPRDISRRDLRKRMRAYREQLGVECSYCHDKDRDTGDVDYATDHNPVKERARTMIQMTDQINDTYLARLGDRRYAEPFECVGCHRGQAKPSAPE